MRTQHPNLWHPIRFAIMLIVLAWTIYGVCYEPPTDISGVIWVAMLVTALVLSPLFLKSTSVAILVIASIGDLFTPYAHLGNSLPAQLYAYGMLAYSTNAIIVATLLIYYVVNILLIDPPDPNTNPVAMVSMYAMVLLLGRTLSWSEKTTQKSFEAAQNKNRLQELEGSVKPTLTYERGALIREEVQTFSLWPLLLNGYRYSKARGVHVQHQCSGCGS